MSDNTFMPFIMVAPNGARYGKQHHRALPLTIADTVQTARECRAAGADAIHAHVRDENGAHTLDSGLYRELLAEMGRQLPQFPVQITTEAAGRYTPTQQRRLLAQLSPRWASVALAEMLADNDNRAAKRAYHDAAANGVRLQHIVYSPQDIKLFADCLASGLIPPATTAPIELLFVLGRYGACGAINNGGIAATPSMLPDYLQIYRQLPPPTKFMVCAFGQAETACLQAAVASGGDCRVGFENNFYHADGRIANNNAERVAALKTALKRIV